ncbi:TetR family transcriptional regulator [Tepidicaulis marinus]|uniref:TetR family transcriptional regulator n=1 Tax=Tepidicaulis marinus TaxID=1333998 RepID=A0A081B805_9HYPH|nr:TetR/AcrR family transcriptional regulator [Tepidicaulis marinus]GAK44173.1 TetR family transcriptional regulator [Tepidicaulis marinus]
MVKADERREAMVDRLADFILAEGLEAAKLRPLAKAAKVSDRMLLYYFKDKSQAVGAALERISSRLVVILGKKTASKPLPYEALLTKLRGIVLAEDMWPYMRLWLEIVALAGRGDAFYRATGEAIGRGMLAWAAGQLDSASAKEREKEAARLFVTIEGMVLLNAVGLGAVSREAFASSRPSANKRRKA